MLVGDIWRMSESHRVRRLKLALRSKYEPIIGYALGRVVLGEEFSLFLLLMFVFDLKRKKKIAGGEKKRRKNAKNWMNMLMNGEDLSRTDKNKGLIMYNVGVRANNNFSNPLLSIFIYMGLHEVDV